MQTVGRVTPLALRLLRERRPDRRLDTNVEFYTALLLHGLGLPSELFTRPLQSDGARLGGTLPRAAPRRQADPAAIRLHRPWRPPRRSLRMSFS
jgi:citrate synthase